MSKLVGIVNVTPDSFSDGGKNFSPEAAIAAAKQLIADGAKVIDIGAESTRPGATPIMPEEEWRRLGPVLQGLQGNCKMISVDTRHADTARKALAAGAQWVNDVSGCEHPDMVAAVKDADCMLVVMHSLSVPADAHIVLPPDTDVVALLIEWAQRRFAALEKAGIARERLIFDPGIGFGKTPAQSFAILEQTHRFDVLGVPLLIGHSRKSFLRSSPIRGEVGRGASTGQPISSEQESPHPNPPPTGEGIDMKTLEWSQKLAACGVDYLRVHDVKTHMEILHGSR